MHLGLIGGIGPAATVLYYERIVDAFGRAGKTPELTIVHTSAAGLSRNVAQGLVEPQVQEYLRVTEHLVGAGADTAVITSMGGHFCFDAFRPLSPLPLVDGPRSVGAYLAREGVARIGILGTRVVMETGLYGALGSIEVVVPKGDELTEANDDYVATAIAGYASQEQADRLLLAGEKLVRDQGAEAVLLGGTDLGLVYDNADVSFSVIDSAHVHVDAIVDVALKGAPFP